MDQKLSNKRKLNDNFAEQKGLKKLKLPAAPSLHPVAPHITELQLQTPHRQRCLNIQHSGNIYLQNNIRMPREQERSPEPRAATRPGHMRLDLELNLLPSEEVSNGEDQKSYDLLLNFGMKKEESNESKKKMSNDIVQISSSGEPSFEGGGDHEIKSSEMVATVCKRCFMLVMLCKASPACPNCKFMHSPDQSAPYLFKKSFTQLLY